VGRPHATGDVVHLGRTARSGRNRLPVSVEVLSDALVAGVDATVVVVLEQADHPA
jgi:hypothetical protein